MALTFLVRVLLCSVVFMPSVAQNLKGSSGIAEMAEVVSKDGHAVQNLEVTWLQRNLQKSQAGSSWKIPSENH